MIPDQVQSTIPIHDRPGLKWGYAVSRRGDRVSAYQQNVIPLRIKPPVCFSSQEELKSVDRLNAPQAKCPRCRLTRAKHLTNEDKAKALALYDKWKADPSEPDDDMDSDVVSIEHEVGHSESNADGRIRELEQRLMQRDHQLDHLHNQIEQLQQQQQHPPRRHDNLAPAAPWSAPVSTTNSVAVTVEFHKVLSTISKQLDSIKWSSQSVARDFIDALDMTLRNSPVPRNQYIHLLPMMIPPKFTNMLEYIDSNISRPLVNWDTAKNIFLRHYQVADWMDTYKREYNSCTQRFKESVQHYADQFSTLSSRLRYDDSNPVNVENFIQRLQPSIQNELTRYRLLLRDTNPAWDWTSLQQVIQKAIEFDVLLNSVSTVNRKAASAESSTSPSAPPNKKGMGTKRSHNSLSTNKSVNHPFKPKKCIHHPNSTNHSTSECRNPSKRAKPSTGETVLTCYSCGEVGHISPKCPNNKSTQGSITKPSKATSQPTTRPGNRSQPPSRSSSRLASASNSKSKSIKAKAVSFHVTNTSDLEPGHGDMDGNTSSDDQ